MLANYYKFIFVSILGLTAFSSCDDCYSDGYYSQANFGYSYYHGQQGTAKLTLYKGGKFFSPWVTVYYPKAFKAELYKLDLPVGDSILKFTIQSDSLTIDTVHLIYKVIIDYNETCNNTNIRFNSRKIVLNTLDTNFSLYTNPGY
ncbi:MAG: hypothetical protein MUC81_09825 [Bacteroidia bacterium]|jgi:hypothetical protein|nr:hypothetical protein [Bacteroidia bacterium]